MSRLKGGRAAMFIVFSKSAFQRTFSRLRGHQRSESQDDQSMAAGRPSAAMNKVRGSVLTAWFGVPNVAVTNLIFVLMRRPP